MAVLVRSAVRQAPALQRALTAAGIPVSVAGDELPLTVEPATRPLLRLMGCAIEPEAMDDQAAAELLTSPLGGTDALGLRRLRRGLVAAARSAGQPPAAEPLADVLRDPRELAQVGWPGAVSTADDRPDAGAADPAVAAARRVAARREVGRAADRSGTPHDVLWAVWDASGLATDSEAASKAGGQRGALADADLDAVVALFDAAERFTARLPHGSTRLFLDSLAGQEIVGDTLAERAPRGETVAVLTAHRAKGLEWDLVVVAGVQEGTWPDIRQRGSLLGMDELVEVVAGREPGETTPGNDVAAVAATARLLADERRLFYVAVTRARRELVVTAIGAADSEERPSRFLTELAGDDIEIEHVASTGRRWLSLPALTADLRRAAADASLPSTRPDRSRDAARQAGRCRSSRRESAALVRADRADRGGRTASR